MLKEVPRIFLHLAHEAARMTPGANVHTVHTIFGGEDVGLANVWMEFTNEFTETHFHGNYRNLLHNQSRISSSISGGMGGEETVR